MKPKIPIRIDMITERVTCGCGDSTTLPRGTADWLVLVSPFLKKHMNCNGYVRPRVKRASGAYARRGGGRARRAGQRKVEA